MDEIDVGHLPTRLHRPHGIEIKMGFFNQNN
jgi:hypothetical protein